jgi:hypothetical protein
MVSETKDKPVYVLMHELKEKKLELEKPKYNLILEFINKAFELELKSLIDMKKYKLSKINMDHFETILDDYRFKLEGELQIEINDMKIDIVKILSDCLKSIDYSLYLHKEKNEEKEKIYLTIMDKLKK